MTIVKDGGFSMRNKTKKNDLKIEKHSKIKNINELDYMTIGFAT